MTSLTSLFQRGMDSGFKRVHGSLDPSLVINTDPGVVIDRFWIEVNGEPFELDAETYAAAVVRLKEHLIFPSTTYSRLHYEIHTGPEIQPLQLHCDTRIECSSPAGPLNYYSIPNQDQPYDPVQRKFVLTLSYKQPPIAIEVSEELHQHFQQGLKIALWVGPAGELLYLPSMQGLRHLEHQQGLRYLEDFRVQIAGFYNMSLNLKPRRPDSILARLPFNCLPVYKVNRRMLHDAGQGTGTKRNTLVHLGKVRQPYASYSDLEDCGRDTELLCGKNGRFEHGVVYSVTKKHATTLSDLGITCPECRKVATRLLQQADSHSPD